MSEDKTSTGIVLPWENAAIRGDEMPDGLEYPDQILFLQLRMLYSQKRQGIIDRDTAIREKRNYWTNTSYTSFGIPWKKNGWRL